MNSSIHNILILWIEIKQALLSERIFEKIQWSVSIVFLIITPLWMLLLLCDILSLINLEKNLVILILFFVYCFSLLILAWLRRHMIHWIENILIHNDKISIIDIRSLNIEDTLSGFCLINKNISNIILWKKLSHWALFYRENGWKEIWVKINRFLESESQYILELLWNIKSDLRDHIEEKQNLLESTKDVIESNITWTTELESVSELQKARLDKQIEQFEELQRVLVKV